MSGPFLPMTKTSLRSLATWGAPSQPPRSSRQRSGPTRPSRSARDSANSNSEVLEWRAALAKKLRAEAAYAGTNKAGDAISDLKGNVAAAKKAVTEAWTKGMADRCALLQARLAVAEVAAASDVSQLRAEMERIAAIPLPMDDAGAKGVREFFARAESDLAKVEWVPSPVRIRGRSDAGFGQRSRPRRHRSARFPGHLQAVAAHNGEAHVTDRRVTRRGTAGIPGSDSSRERSHGASTTSRST